jgi:adenylate cyclase class IV
LCLDDVTGLGVFLELERLVPAEIAGLAAQAELAVRGGHGRIRQNRIA